MIGLVVVTERGQVAFGYPKEERKKDGEKILFIYFRITQHRLDRVADQVEVFL